MKPLSFVIITYNRPADTLELLKNISGLNRAGDLLEDVIVLNNASEEDYSDVRAFISAEKTIPLRFIEAPSNLGVTRGRNHALDHAKGDIVIFLDDDAVLGNPDALENVVRSFTTPGFEGRPVAIVSFRVLYYSTGEMQVNALPHKKFKKFSREREFFTYYFAGGAHAIRRSLLEQAGRLPEEFFYGMEEYDLSYRIIEAGYCIKYDSSIEMRHKESTLGRKPRPEKLRMMWVNKGKVAWRYLPKRYFLSTVLLWSFQYLKVTRFSLGGYISGWKQILSIPRTERRTPLSRRALEYLRKVEARLWY